MDAGFFHAALYQPLYNGLVFLIDVLPGADAGFAVILLTLAVKLVLFPLSHKAARTQLLMRALEPRLRELKERYKNNREEQAKQMLALYKAERVNPFSSIFLLLIQLPIIYALYFIFFKSGLPVVDEGILYQFVMVPSAVNMEFLGLIDIGGKSISLALAAGATQFFQARIAAPLPPSPDGQKSFATDLARSMHLQMRYVFPVIVFLIAWQISGAVALYWATSNLFMIGQELFLRRKLAKGAS